jgi:hypothetical protein
MPSRKGRLASIFFTDGIAAQRHALRDPAAVGHEQRERLVQHGARGHVALGLRAAQVGVDLVVALGADAVVPGFDRVERAGRRHLQAAAQRVEHQRRRHLVLGRGGDGHLPVVELELQELVRGLRVLVRARAGERGFRAALVEHHELEQRAVGRHGPGRERDRADGRERRFRLARLPYAIPERSRTGAGEGERERAAERERGADSLHGARSVASRGVRIAPA